MKKELKVAYPPITSYMTHAPILSIISDTDDYLPWFIFNYIQIRVAKDGIDFYNEVFSCPHIETMTLNRDFIVKFAKMDIVDFFIECINQDYYILAIIDRYFISLYENYNKHHFEHPIFIYGFDKDEKEFLAGEFFKVGKYSFRRVSFLELIDAYKNCDENRFWLKGIKLFKRTKHTHLFKINDFINYLGRYLHGYELSADINNYVGYGLNSLYDRLSTELWRFSSFLESDSRVLPIFCDHKKVLNIAIEYLVKIGQQQLEHLLPSYNELYDQTIMYRNKYLKLMVTNQNNLLNNKKLDELKSKEINLLENTIELLSR